MMVLRHGHAYHFTGHVLGKPIGSPQNSQYSEFLGLEQICRHGQAVVVLLHYRLDDGVEERIS